MAELVLSKPKQKHWISYIKQRIKKNKNFIAFISGQTGSGKSWSSLSIGQDLEEEFGIARVVFSALDLMKLINSGTLKRGSVIILEEAGVEASNKNWYSITNKVLNYLCQTFRNMGIILILNSPYMDFVDSGIKKLFHAEFQTISINYKTEECKIKPQLLQYNSRLQKWYYKRLKVITTGGILPITYWNVHKPSKELIKAYEEKKNEFTVGLNKSILSQLEVEQEKNQNKKAIHDLTEVQSDTLELLKQGLTIDAIAKKRNRAKAVIWASMKLIKKKGFEIKPIYESGKVIRYNVQGIEVKSDQ